MEWIRGKNYLLQNFKTWVKKFQVIIMLLFAINNQLPGFFVSLNNLLDQSFESPNALFQMSNVLFILGIEFSS